MGSDAIPRADIDKHDEELIRRYTFAERANHWIGAAAYIYLLMTGLAFWSPYLFWLAAIVGGGTSARFWHPIFGLVFFFSVWRTYSEWRGDMKMDDSDRAWSRAIAHYIENDDDKLPPVGRFNFGQKAFFWGILYSVILLLLSGLILWFTQYVPWDLRYLRYFAVLFHAGFAMLTIGLFIIHVYMSAIMEEGSLGSMIHGTVTRAWAWTFHRTWYERVKGASSSKQ